MVQGMGLRIETNLKRIIIVRVDSKVGQEEVNEEASSRRPRLPVQSPDIQHPPTGLPDLEPDIVQNMSNRCGL